MRDGGTCNCGCELVMVELKNDLRVSRLQARLAGLGAIAGGLTGFLSLHQERITGIVLGLVGGVVCGTFLGGIPLMFQPIRCLIITRQEVQARQRTLSRLFSGTLLVLLSCSCTVALSCLWQFRLDSPIPIIAVIGAVTSLLVSKVLSMARAELETCKCSGCQEPFNTAAIR